MQKMQHWLILCLISIASFMGTLDGIVAGIIFILSFAMFSIMSQSTSLLFIILGLALEGIAIGLMVPPNFALILGASPSGEEGMMNSIVSTLRNIGAVIGIAIFGLVFLTIVANSGISPAGTLPHDIPSSVRVPGFNATFFLGTLFTIILLILNILLREKKAG